MADKQANPNANRATAPGDMNGKSEADVAANRKQPANDEGGTVVQRFYTKDGTPVEPSTLMPKDTTGRRPDVSSRPDVVEKAVHIDEDGTIREQD